MVEVLFHPEAQDEYDAARTWYRVRSPQAATRFETEMERTLGLISDNPETYPMYDDDHRFAIVRRLPYSIVYHVEADQVYVVAVAHSSRSPGYWQGRA